jgi:hypothetical protein
VVPLALYLVSLILCFEGRRWYRRWLYLPLLPVALFAMAAELYIDPATIGIATLVVLYCAGLFVCCMVCHGELAARRPAAEHLTAFYLMLSAGGAAGGLFVAVVAPNIFSGYFELPVGLILCAGLTLAVLGSGWVRAARGRWRWPALGIGAAVTVALTVFALGKVRDLTAGARLLARDFYGVLIVSDTHAQGRRPATRLLTNGVIDHGEQILAPAQGRVPTTWYGHDSGIGVVLDGGAGYHPRRVGVIGLGAGTIAAYGRPGDAYRFYEINPKAVGVAHTQFSFLNDSRAQVGVVLGDARLSLEREPPQHFDVLAADAFNGDSVPIHLLTVQAFALYFRHLQPGTGILAVHVSNTYLDLVPVVARAARALGKSAVWISSVDHPRQAVYGSDWVLLTSSRGLADRLVRASNGDGTLLSPHVTGRPWTDDYSNLLGALR